MKFTSVLSNVAVVFAAKSLAISWEEADAKAREWCKDLTNGEKITLITGRENMTGVCVGSIDPIERKDFKGICLQDRPAGVRFAKGTATSWQASINTVATFDRKLLRKVGEAQGKEFYQRGINVALAPSMGIQRAPAAGRIFESYGEDPFYVGQCGLEVLKGIQSQGVIANAKHFIANDQENNRGASTSNVPEQALWDVYMEPFYRTVIDGEASRLLTDSLKGKLGFQGFVMSDWWAIFDIEKSFGAGTDMNMPGGKYWGSDYVDDSFWGRHILECIEKGIFPQERLDDAVLRIIRTMYKLDQMDNYPEVNLYVDTNTKENAALNRKVGADSNVLLKNADHILPLKKSKKVKKIAVIGKDSMSPTLCEDMKCANGTLPLGWGSGTTDFKEQKKANLKVISYGDDDGKKAAKVAKNADVAIVFVQADSGEEYITVEGNAGDRLNLDLWHGGNELIEAVAAVNKNTIVVIHSPGPVNVPFLDKVKGVIFAGLPGQETGNAITDVLFGDVNPSGHLPYTWAPREDYPTDVKYEPEYPGGGDKMTVYDYNEGLFVGYRWFDKNEIKPTFPLGYGLSYTTFEYSNLEADMEDDGLYVTLNVKNTGKIAGAAVPMIFLSFPESVKDYPVRLFKGFDKVVLKAGQSKEVKIFIDDHALSYYDEGEFTVFAGSNASDLPLKVKVLANGDDYSEDEAKNEEEEEASAEIEEDNEDSVSEDEKELKKRFYKIY
ncbi:beta-glucosidase [Neocallimastix lanati (nom. inval.)]|uniref:Probable beta-glucosidase G n=1 Tax=Neocallimastix californiae TaxID=1754190 RepID=A0A1Y2FL13_9FUNG|nr:beta-glucosidase [Neocallimastix sp. JGI-2020a]ORY84619.1 beta-glucosidase [Neocallimastix californiae]|eukprot:ORY84619.1 beta-glucosidase [Neocallimastix californiae]